MVAKRPHYWDKKYGAHRAPDVQRPPRTELRRFTYSLSPRAAVKCLSLHGTRNDRVRVFIRDAGDEVLHAKAEEVFVAAERAGRDRERRASEECSARAERRESSPWAPQFTKPSSSYADAALPSPFPYLSLSFRILNPRAIPSREEGGGSKRPQGGFVVANGPPARNFYWLTSLFYNR